MKREKYVIAYSFFQDLWNTHNPFLYLIKDVEVVNLGKGWVIKDNFGFRYNPIKEHWMPSGLPSSRTDEFIAQTNYDNPDVAVKDLRKALKIKLTDSHSIPADPDSKRRKEWDDTLATIDIRMTMIEEDFADVD